MSALSQEISEAEEMTRVVGIWIRRSTLIAFLALVGYLIFIGMSAGVAGWLVGLVGLFGGHSNSDAVEGNLSSTQGFQSSLVIISWGFISYIAGTYISDFPVITVLIFSFGLVVGGLMRPLGLSKPLSK